MSFVDGELTSIALCWRLERSDGAGLALTSHDREITSEDVLYAPASGINPAAITRKLGIEPQSSEVAGALSSDALDERDLSLGRWDGARVSLTAVDWQDPKAEPIRLLGGRLGGVSIDGDGFSADLEGAATRLLRPVCPSTSAECRAELGDKACRVDLAGRSIIAHVLGSRSAELTLDRPVDDRFVLGRLRYLDGENCGVSTIILSATGSTVIVRDLPRGTVESGCRIELREGCDKRFATCVSRFANAVNFRGEPHLPGNDLLTRYPGA